MAFKKILVIKFRSLGDTALMMAPLTVLRHAYPSAEIHVAVTARWAPILQGHPAVDKVWEYERRDETAARAKAIAALALKLRAQRYDCVVNFHASPSSSTLAFATGARTRSVHYHGLKDKNRYSTVEIPGKGTVKPAIERDMDALRALGLKIPEGAMPEIMLAQGELDEARAWMQKMRLQTPVLTLGLGASRTTKVWPIERFSQLAIEWTRETGGSVLAFTGKGEAHFADEFMVWVNEALLQSDLDDKKRAEIRDAILAPAPLPLRQVAAVLNLASVCASNDSGLKHVAVALRTPTVTMIGPEHPFEWHPYPTDQYPFLFVDNLVCRRDAQPGMPPWCGLEVCTVERHKCMKQITVEQVLTECKRVHR